MKRQLGTLLTLLLLLFAAGCGDDTGDDAGADDPSSSGSASPTDSPTDSDPAGEGAVDFTEVALLSETNAGGEVSPQPTVLDSPAAIEGFAAGLEGNLAAKVQAAAANAEVPDGEVLLGAVVALGCDVPPGVSVERTAAGLGITALKVAKPKQECFAPVTSVALVTVAADAVTTG